ncbi:hypothetical protein PS850_00959 [Pseudomonas fluorescens]|nr:hypothetical protein PS850_00959 [Pseudomonas fluorescens]
MAIGVNYEMILDEMRLRLKSGDVLSEFLELNKNLKPTSEKWANSIAWNFIPFYSELTGYGLNSFLVGSPKNKKKKVQYIFSNGAVVEINNFNSQGGAADRSLIIYNESMSEMLTVDEDDIPYRLSRTLKKGDLLVSSFIVQDDGQYWVYEYLWELGVIVGIRDFSLNSAKPFVELSVAYSESGEVDRISYLFNDEQVSVYDKK